VKEREGKKKKHKMRERRERKCEVRKKRHGLSLAGLATAPIRGDCGAWLQAEYDDKARSGRRRKRF